MCEHGGPCAGAHEVSVRFKIEQGKELLSSKSGLALVGQILPTVGLGMRLDKVALPNYPSPEISH